MEKEESRVGLWLIGAMGNISVSTVSGLSAIRQSITKQSGLVTALPLFNPLCLPSLDQLVVGGHDLRIGSVGECAALFDSHSRALPLDIREAARDDYAAFESRIRLGVDVTDDRVADSRAPLAELVEKLEQDIACFRSDNGLDEVVVINVATTESNSRMLPSSTTLDVLEHYLSDNQKSAICNSVLYAYAAIRQKCAYVNFTPSMGSELAALRELADLMRVPHGGKDGKTGETLVKSQLATMFVFRNLDVLSWSGFNILGNSDGESLQDPLRKAAKVGSKSDVLRSAFGGASAINPHVGIEFVPSLGDWKIAWDHIHFRGWLDCRMSLQFIWQGCDSMLAAPLIIDLARLSVFALRRRETGIMRHLSAFFKSPIDVSEHAFYEQHRLLVDYVRNNSNQHSPVGDHNS